MINGHAALSPSGSGKWTGCPGSLFMEKGLTEDPSIHAATGTAAHFLAEWGFNNCQGKLPGALVGKRLLVTETDTLWYEGIATERELGERDFIIEVTQDMLEKIQGYIDWVLDCVREVDGELLVEQKLGIEHITGEKDAEGSSDGVILAPKHRLLETIDLKYGHNPVAAENNSQLVMYSLGALEEFGDMFSIERVRMSIYMPNLNIRDTWEITVDELKEWGESLKVSAKVSLDILEGRQELDVDKHITPGPHCQKGFCKARATCKKLHDEVVDLCDFGALPASPEEVNAISVEQMGYILSKKDQAIDWFGAIEKRVAALMLSGTKVPHHKLVMGKEGNRTWDDTTEVEAMLRSMKIKLEDMYDTKVITPTTAGKLAAKGVIGPKQWKKLGERITRNPAKPKVVLGSAKGEAIEVSAPAGDFEALD